LAESFRWIRLRQTGTTHCGDYQLIAPAFEIFGAVAGLQ
jgi:hypothetical protein